MLVLGRRKNPNQFSLLTEVLALMLPVLDPLFSKLEAVFLGVIVPLLLVLLLSFFSNLPRRSLWAPEFETLRTTGLRPTPGPVSGIAPQIRVVETD